MLIAENIKHLRTSKGWKQSELAEQLGKTNTAISDYEKGKAQPPLDVVQQLSQIFNVSVDDLINKDLRRADLLQAEGIAVDTESSYRARYEDLKKRLSVQEQLTELQGQRLKDLEREIREHAPELARRLGL